MHLANVAPLSGVIGLQWWRCLWHCNLHHSSVAHLVETSRLQDCWPRGLLDHLHHSSVAPLVETSRLPDCWAPGLLDIAPPRQQPSTQLNWSPLNTILFHCTMWALVLRLRTCMYVRAYPSTYVRNYRTLCPYVRTLPHDAYILYILHILCIRTARSVHSVHSIHTVLYRSLIHGTRALTHK